MKKMIVVCFAFMFLLAIFAGCPTTPEKPKSDSSSGAVEFGEDDSGASLVSSDEASGE